jgi:hypothetical protein
MDEYDKLQHLFEHLLDQTIDSVYINENDEFVMEFSDGSLIELFSDEGDIGIYFEIGSGDEPTIQ